jgi:dCTP deaminase
VILCKYDIQEELASGRLKIDPPVDPASVAQISIDLHLGRKFTIFKKPKRHIASFYVGPEILDSDLWDTKEADEFTLAPRGLVLAQTLETVRIPSHLMGLVEGRSSLARLGLTVHISAPKIDPGWEGPITLELANLSEVSYTLRAEKDKLAQLMLLKLSRPLEEVDMYGPGDRFYRQDAPIPTRRS